MVCGKCHVRDPVKKKKFRLEIFVNSVPESWTGFSLTQSTPLTEHPV